MSVNPPWRVPRTALTARVIVLETFSRDQSVALTKPNVGLYLVADLAGPQVIVFAATLAKGGFVRTQPNAKPVRVIPGIPDPVSSQERVPVLEETATMGTRDVLREVYVALKPPPEKHVRLLLNPHFW